MSFPGWIVALTTPLFVVTWVVAPRETISGTLVSRPVFPDRRPGEPPPIMQLHHPQLVYESAPTKPIYGLERVWNVAFTFDDGPHPVYTKRLLEILQRHQIRATFFINGYWLDARHRRGAPALRKLVQQAHNAGHTIGNHTYSHARLSLLPPDEQRWQIMTNHRLIMELTGVRPTLFRPPYATMTDAAREVIQDLGYAEALWSATALDQEVHDPEQISHTVLSWLRTYKGGIVMLHDRFRWSVEATDLILQALERENCRRLRHRRPMFRVVSLDSFLRPPPQSWALQIANGQQRREEQLRQLCSR